MITRSIIQDISREIARRATAIYFDVGIHPSFLECLGQPEFDRSPAGRMLKAIIQACEDTTDVLVLDSKNMDSRTYSPVTVEKIKQFLTDVKALNFEMTGNDRKGAIHAYGSTVEYTFINQTLKIDVFGILPHALIWMEIEQRLPSGVTRVG
jgi:Tat protein secretion system quality control protein TatD with DNase activity